MYMNEAGVSKIKIVLVLAALIVIIHTGIKVGDMYLDYYRMEDEMMTQASMAQVLKNEEIVADLVKKAKELDLPLTAENFELKRNAEQQRMRISTQWNVEVHFLFNAYVRTFHFAPRVDQSFRK